MPGKDAVTDGKNVYVGTLIRACANEPVRRKPRLSQEGRVDGAQVDLGLLRRARERRRFWCLASEVDGRERVECSKQTVIDTFRAFANEGLLIEVGRRKTSNGFVVMYDMNIAAIGRFQTPFRTKN